MRRILAAVVIGCAAAAAAAAPHAGSMQILTADIPPMAFMKDGRVTGYCVDIVHEIQRRIGNSTEIELQPWARAYRSALEGENVLLVCPKRTPDREGQFKWVGPLFTSQTNFYARPADRVRIHSLEDAKKLSGVLAPRDFYSYQYLSDAGFKNLEPTNNTLTMLRLLEEAGAHPEQVEMVYTAFTIGSYLSFPRQAPAELVAQWQRALDKMKQDGAFARIYRQWYQQAPPPDVMK